MAKRNENAMLDWIDKPSPHNAVELAIEDHKAYCESVGTTYDWQFIETLREVQLIVAKNAARNRKTGGK